MIYLFVCVSAVVLFFLAYFLLSPLLGTDWAAGIAAFIMYIGYPVAALLLIDKFKPKPKRVWPRDLESREYQVTAAVEVEEYEDEGCYFLLAIDPNKTLCLFRSILYDIVEAANFLSSRIRLHFSRHGGYAVEALGGRVEIWKHCLRLPKTKLIQSHGIWMLLNSLYRQSSTVSRLMHNQSLTCHLAVCHEACVRNPRASHWAQVSLGVRRQ